MAPCHCCYYAIFMPPLLSVIAMPYTIVFSTIFERERGESEVRRREEREEASREEERQRRECVA